MFQSLVAMVTTLQVSMAREQREFDDLTGRLAALTCGDDAPEHIKLSTELMRSQTRLTTLMARNMKCFMQVSLSKATQYM